MYKRVNYCWRLAGTGIAFASFGLGGLFMTMFVFKIIAAVTPDENLRIKRVRHVIYSTFRLFVFMLRISGVINSRFYAVERLNRCRGALIVANHPSLLDTVFLMSQMPNVQCIIKHELWENKFLGGVMRAAGYIRNDGNVQGLLEQCKNSLEMGQNILIFPEGTRTVPGQKIKFQRGFANIAVYFSTPIQLVTIKCNPSTLAKGSPWYDIPSRQSLFDITFDEQLDMSDYLRHEPRSIKVRRLTDELEQYYGRKLSYE
ncbi:MAG: 1-acyl-sn-glycerol-3-phosphate acyltransferase [Sneathiella sp.]|uniref:lysophospholipid acyltransferase family protein n=1 Tax=Sneathiella sp. TaxID=1964365 RepID=UPI003001CB17